MILNKYNEIMERVTIDPEMKSRVMSAVSAAIKEQSGGAATVTGLPKHVNQNRTETVTHNRPEVQEKPKKKAKKVPIAIISSIAAAVVVLAGALFIFSQMGATSSSPAYKNSDAASTQAMAVAGGDSAAPAVHNEQVEAVANEIDGLGEYYAEETTAAADNDSKTNLSGSTSTTYSTTVNTTNNKDLNSISTVEADEKEDRSNDNEGMGDSRLDRINKTLPFDLKGTGSGKFSEDITFELFIGEQGQKVILLEGPEGKDLVGAYEPFKNAAGETNTTPEGTSVTLYKIAFGNISDVTSGDATEVNAALFTRNGHTYLLVFSDIQSTEMILTVVDAV